jgi:hypothetical protein
VKECWNGSGGPRGLSGEDILLPARIARVATEATLFHGLRGAELGIQALTRRAGGMLDPSIVAKFVANTPMLIGELGAGDPREQILSVEPQPVVEKGVGELAQVAVASEIWQT